MGCCRQTPAPAAWLTRAPAPYGAGLSRVYFAASAPAVRCATPVRQAFPAQAKAGERAYAAWQPRHKALLAELDARVTQMIRGASKDEKEYMRNVGKYEGSILEYRNGERDELLAQPRDGMEQGCARFPQLPDRHGLGFPRRNMPNELRVLRQRKLPK